MSVVVPVYQEDPEVFTTALESWLSNGVDQVILVVDVTDTVCLQIAQHYAQTRPVTVVMTDVPGKRDALRRGWNAAATELVALVDSDTVWAPDVAAEVCKPFVDPRIGGVGTRQSVYQGRGLLSRFTDMFLDHRYFDENACQTYMGRAVSCLSGRTAIYRRSVLLAIEYEFMTETFWGVPCLSGDDKRLTTLTLQLGYQTYMQRTARVWSTFPTRWGQFTSQRLRWARNTWRSDVRALSQPWVWRHPFLAYTLVDKAISCFTLLLGPIFMGYALAHRHWAFAGVLALWWQISRSAKLLPHLRQRPSSFLFIPGYVVLSWVMALIKIRALLTIRKQRWLTRDVAVEGGAVVRTDAVSVPGPVAGPGWRGGPPGGFPTYSVVVAVLALALSVAAPSHLAVGPVMSSAVVASVADDEPLPADSDTQDPTPEPDPTSEPNPTPEPEPTSEPPKDSGGDSGGDSGQDKTQEKADEAAAQAAQRAAHQQVIAAHRADLAARRQQHDAAAAASATAMWQRRGQPEQLVIIRARNVDLVAAGRLLRRVPRPATPVLTLRDLSHLLPPDWLAIADDGTARLFAAVAVGAGTTLDTGGDVPRLWLAGSANPARAAWLWVGHARLNIHNVEMDSFDRDAGGDNPAAASAAGRPFIDAGAGATLDITDASVHDLGAKRAAIGYGTGSTGSISRAELSGNTVGIRLGGSHDVHLDTVTVSHSSGDGLILHGDVNTTFHDVDAVKNGRNGLSVTGPSTDRKITGIATRGNARFGVAIIAQQHPTIDGLATSEDHAGGLRLTNTTAATVSNTVATDEPVGLLINGIRNTGTHVQRAHIKAGHDAVILARGSTATVLTDLDIKGADRDGISTAGTDTQITGGSIIGGHTGINARTPTRVAHVSITGVGLGLRVAPTASLAADTVDVLATGTGLKVDPSATATVTTSRIRAYQSLRGPVTLIGANAITPAPFNWIGAFGAMFVVLAFALEVIATIRGHRRDRRLSPVFVITPPPGWPTGWPTGHAHYPAAITNPPPPGPSVGSSNV